MCASVASTSSTSNSTSGSTSCLFVQENNRGLIYLKDGDICRARKCFANALRNAQIGLVNTATATTTTTTTPASSTQTTTIQQQPHVVPVEEEGTTTESSSSSNATTTTTTANSDNETNNNNNNNIREELFARLCILPTSELQNQALSIFIDQTQISSANMALIYSAIIYNMGLVYHVRGNMNTTSSATTTSSKASTSGIDDGALIKALELYSKSLSIIMVELQSSSGGSSSQDNNVMMQPPVVVVRNPIIDLLRMSLIRHMADIYLMMSDYTKARQLGDELSKFILNVAGGHNFIYPDPRVTQLMQNQVGCFLMYSLSLQQCSLLAPAA